MASRLAKRIRGLAGGLRDRHFPGGKGRRLAARARALARVDVTHHNDGSAAPTFESLVSQVVSAAQFSEPSFDRVRQVLFPQEVRVAWGPTQARVDVLHRKTWE